MKINRRQFVRNLGLGTASLSMGSLISTSSCAPSGDSRDKRGKVSDDDQFLFIGDDIAIAQTEYGKVQGYLLNHVYTFLGVPYGADTSGKNRFMPPQKPEPWTDVRPAVFYGNTAPQRMENRWPNNYGTFADHWNYWDVSEDCLYLNVWTPGIADGKKRPVLVWLHGGGFTNGSGIEQDGYHGENISREGDIVFCSINHRLGPTIITLSILFSNVKSKVCPCIIISSLRVDKSNDKKPSFISYFTGSLSTSTIPIKIP